MIKYKFEYDDQGYIIGFYEVLDDSYEYIGNFTDTIICEGWYKFINGEFIEDPVKKEEIITERERQAKAPTWNEMIESQTFYTAMMTDTLLED